MGKLHSPVSQDYFTVVPEPEHVQESIWILYLVSPENSFLHL